jgi:hypothetical protein
MAMKKRATKGTVRSRGAKSRTTKRKGRPAKSKARSARKAKPKKISVPRRRRPPARAKRSGQAVRRSRAHRAQPGTEDVGRLTQLHEDRIRHHETSPALSAGDVDADWAGAEGSGEESVGGSVATPDQDVVDEIGRALGVAQAPTQPVTTSEEILRERARHRWEIEREASQEEDRRDR